MLIAYASGHVRVRQSMDEAVGRLQIGSEGICSTLGRMVARGVETLLVAEQLPIWIAQLEANMQRGDLAVHNGFRWDPASWPAQATGWGWAEAPRGALGHWIGIADRKIRHYQTVVPTTWNGSPRDDRGQRGAWEEALIGTPVADPSRPLEILRTIHAFDPCMACAVH
jgi:Ni,Fe-hydrogenase I large subunit